MEKNENPDGIEEKQSDKIMKSKQTRNSMENLKDLGKQEETQKRREQKNGQAKPKSKKKNSSSQNKAKKRKPHKENEGKTEWL